MFDSDANHGAETPGWVINYTPDLAGRTVTVAGTLAGASTTYASVPAGGYWPHGAIQTLALGNGLTETTVYNPRLQMTAMTAKRNGSTLLGLTYTYPASGNNGNLQNQTIQNDAIGSESAFSVTQGYTSYDGVNRLTGFSENGHNQAYGYDAFGNRWVSSSDTVYPANALTPTQQSFYDASTNRFLVTNNCATNSSTGYDQRGNLESQCPFSLGYDGEDRQISATSTNPSVTATYGYDGNGQRVQKVVNGTTTNYVYDAFGSLAAEYTTAAPTVLGTEYYTADHLGSTRLITNAAAVWRTGTTTCRLERV